MTHHIRQLFVYTDSKLGFGSVFNEFNNVKQFEPNHNLLAVLVE